MLETARRILICLTIITSGQAYAGGTLYVRTDGNDASAGTTPQTALLTLQEAVNRCDSDAWTIFVAPGTYIEMVEIGTGAGAAAQSGSTGSPNSIVGDITGIATESAAGPVMIDGGGSRTRGFNISARSNWSFTNLTLQNQTQYNIFSTNASGLTIDNCSFADATLFAAYLINGMDISITDSTFHRDGAERHAVWMAPSWRSTGSGYFHFNRNTMVATGDRYTNSPYPRGQFRMNGRRRVYEYGAIIVSYGRTNMDIEITNNVCSDYYLPLYAYSRGVYSTINVSNNTVSRCLYAQYVFGPSNQAVTMTNNIASETYWEPFVYPSRSTIENNLIDQNIRNFRRGFSNTPGLIQNEDPLFADPAGGDFTLTSASPAIDTGSETAGLTDDLLGNRRPYDGDGDGTASTDIGTYEYGSSPASRDIRVVQWQSVPPVDHR